MITLQRLRQQVAVDSAVVANQHPDGVLGINLRGLHFSSNRKLENRPAFKMKNLISITVLSGGRVASDY
jgi:hypothetical protein